MDNYLTRASDYGDVTSYWQGVELTVNARTNNGLTLQGGVTTGAGTRDNCEITSKVPELLIVAGRAAGHFVVPRGRAVAAGMAWPDQLHDSEDRRAAQRHHAVAAEHRGDQ